MRKNIFIVKKNDTYIRRYDYYSYVYYRYHKLFLGSLIFRGKKLWALNFFLDLKYGLKKKENASPFWVFLVACMKITPDLMLYPLKLGGVVLGVPLYITERKRYTFCCKWVIKLLKDKQRKITLQSLVDTLVMAIYNKGIAIEKKMSVYETSSLNRHLIKRFR